jgi:hypothetical protein
MPVCNARSTVNRHSALPAGPPADSAAVVPPPGPVAAAFDFNRQPTTSPSPAAVPPRRRAAAIPGALRRAGHRSLSLASELQHRDAQAYEHSRQALDLFTAAGHASGRAHALNDLGWSYAQLGDFEAAADYCRLLILV